MKHILLAAFAALFFIGCKGQEKTDTINNITYYTPSSARWISEFKLRGDSLTISKSRDGGISDIMHYKIVGKEIVDEHFILYTENMDYQSSPNSAPVVIKKFEPYVEVLIINFPEQGKIMFVSKLNQPSRSLDEAKQAVKTINFNERYYTHWYTRTMLEAFLKYPELSNADETTTQKVADDYVNYVTQNANKIRASRASTSYQEPLSQVLIANHLNPLGTMEDIDKKMNKYRLRFPIIR